MGARTRVKDRYVAPARQPRAEGGPKTGRSGRRHRHAPWCRSGSCTCRPRRGRLAWGHALARAVLGVYVRVLLGFQRHRARRSGIRGGWSGCVTVIQRFGGGLLLFDGVFHTPDEGDRLDTLDPSDADLVRADPVIEKSPVLAGISSASIQGRIALGSRAGARVWRVGADPDAPWVLSTAPRHAHLTGFDLHANVAVPAADRARLEHLYRYLLCPAVAQGRLRLLDDGRIVLTLKTAWADGTRHLVFEPLTLLEKLAALTPRPRISLVPYHGVLAPNARLASPRGLVRRPAG